MTEWITDKCHIGSGDRKIEGMCYHKEIDHKNGSCMYVTQKDLNDLPTMSKYCPCGVNGGFNLRLYSLVGFMEPTFRDFMITDKCWSCGQDVLIRVNQKVCVECQNILGVEQCL